MSRILPVVLLAAALGAVSLPAQPVTQLPADIGDFTLTNGKSYKGAVVISQTSAAINIRHSGGITKVEKSLLPPELQQRFPVDDAMAAREQQARAEDARRREEADRIARQKKLAQQATARAAAVTPPTTSSTEKPASAGARTSPAYATPAEQVARAPYGLYIKNWNGGSGNTVLVTVRNPTGSPQKMDPRQLRGLVAGSGQTVEGTDLQYGSREIANQWVDAGQDRTFTVVFPTGGFAAIAWADGKEWRVRTSTEAAVATSPTEAINLAREVAAEAKERGRHNSAAAQAAAAKAQQDKRLIAK